MAPLPMPFPRLPFRMAIVTLSSCLWAASCAPDSLEASSSGLSSPLAAPQVRARTLLVHLYYRTEEDLSRFSEELDLLEHADRAAGYVDALVDEETRALLEQKGFKVVVDEE